MGQKNKLLLPWHGTTILASVVKTLVASSLAEILVVTGHQSSSISALLVPYPVRLVKNRQYAEGLSTSIRAGVNAAQPCSGYLFALGDMPLISSASIRRLCQAFTACKRPDAIVFPTWEGKRGNPVIISQTYRNQLLALRGDQGARPLLQRYAERTVGVPLPDPGVLVDIDTPQTYQNAQGNL
jgi:molybdenum cofactor cytidylyltransferase